MGSAGQRPELPGVYGFPLITENLVHIHILKIPQKSLLVVPTLPVRVIKATVLHGADVPFEQTAQTLTFSLLSGSEDSIYPRPEA